LTKEAYYFSHDANARQDEKILMLRAEHGWEGYGIYWALVEMMFESSETALHFNKIKGIAVSYNVDITVLKAIINTCITEKLFVGNDEIFWSESLKRRKLKYHEAKEKKSEAGKKGMAKRWETQFDEEKDNTVITKDNNVITKDNTVITELSSVITENNKGKEMKEIKEIKELISTTTGRIELMSNDTVTLHVTKSNAIEVDKDLDLELKESTTTGETLEEVHLKVFGKIIMSPLMSEFIRNIKKEGYTDEFIQEIMLEAGESGNNPSIRFMESIFKRWQKEKINTRAEARNRKEAHKQKPNNKIDPQLENRRREIAFNRHMNNGGHEDEFIYHASTSV
jgi:DnaD/phage-associated family protein